MSRENVFSGLREDIRSLMNEMGHEPESSLERESISPDTDIFLLTHDNIKALKLLLSQVLIFSLLQNKTTVAVIEV